MGAGASEGRGVREKYANFYAGPSCYFVEGRVGDWGSSFLISITFLKIIIFQFRKN